MTAAKPIVEYKKQKTKTGGVIHQTIVNLEGVDPISFASARLPKQYAIRQAIKHLLKDTKTQSLSLLCHYARISC